MSAFFATYDVTTEVIMLVLVVALLILVWITQPSRSYMMNLCMMGFLNSILTILAHIGLLVETIHMRETGSYLLFNCIYVLFSILFIIQLNLIITYLVQLSYKRRFHFKKLIVYSSVFSTVCMLIVFIPLAQNKLLDYKDGIYTLTVESNSYVFCSLLCAIVCFVLSFVNRREVTKIVNRGCTYLIPIVALGVVCQFYFPTAFFICSTYSLPFLLYYILFHSIKYDEIMGCQNAEAENTLLNRYLKADQKFLLISIQFPKLENRDFKDIKQHIIEIGSQVFRQIERLNNRIRIYQLGSCHYQIICPIDSDREFNLLKNKFLAVITTPILHDKRILRTPIHLMVAKEFDSIETADDYLSLVSMKQKEFTNPDQNELLYLSEEDCIRYKKVTTIEKNLLDIKNEGNLEDERVQVFIQPIYCISTGTFRTGEALMRLKFDDKMVFPDESIPIAEDIGCIHSLTRIMLHKVAKKTIELSKEKDFDAITVNVSTIELTDPKVGKEFYDIITEAGADPSNIRLEITESTTISDYQTIINNIEYLRERGIQFYLDDFGTGYSNLERIASIPFKTIKFDKSLLYKALEDQKSEDLFLLLLKYFKSNGFSTVIEGVEDENQKEYVSRAGFDYIQGYFFSKPVEAASVDSFFNNR